MIRKSRTSVFIRYALSYIAVVLLLFCSITGYLYVRLSREAREEIIDNQINRLSRIASQHESYISAMLNTAEEIGLSPDIEFFRYNEEPWKDCYDEGEGDCCIHVYTANNSGQSTEIIKNKEGTYIDLFPDPLIRANMLSEYDKDGDQYITTEELMSIMITPYDVDGDGQANSVDLTLLKRAALGLQEPDGKYHWYAGDLSVNSYIDEADARIMLSFVLQKPPK